MAENQTNHRGNLKTDPIRNFRFLVSVLPYETGTSYRPFKDNHFGFTSVSGLSTATEAIPYREGGYNTTVHQLPGQTTFSPVTLQRGVHLGNDSAWRWMRLLFAVNAAKGPRPGPAKNFRASVRIDVLQHPVKMGEDEGANETLEADGTTNGFAENDPVAVSFKLYNAWITSLAYSDLNAGDNALVVEQMTIVHEGFDMWWNNSLGTSVDGAAMFSV